MEGSRLSFDEAGEAGAPAIVLLHGGGAGSWTWQRHVAALADRYHVIAPDLPEHRGSAGIAPFTFERAAALVADLIRERVGAPAHVAGLSLGAQTLARMLADTPDVVETAFLSGCLVRPVPGASLAKGMTAMYWPFRNAEWLVRANMKALGVPDRDFEEFARDTRETTLESMNRISAANVAFRPPPGLADVRVPVLVTVGEKEIGVMRGSARDLVAAVPGAIGRVVAGHGHNWPVTDQALYLETLTAWTEGRPLPDALVPLG